MVLVLAVFPAAAATDNWGWEDDGFHLYSKELVFTLPEGWVETDGLGYRYFTLGDVEETKTSVAILGMNAPELGGAYSVYFMFIGPDFLIGNETHPDEAKQTVESEGLTGNTEHILSSDASRTHVLWIGFLLHNPNEYGYYAAFGTVPAGNEADIAWFTGPMMEKYPEFAGLLPEMAKQSSFQPRQRQWKGVGGDIQALAVIYGLWR